MLLDDSILQPKEGAMSLEYMVRLVVQLYSNNDINFNDLIDSI